MIALPGIVLLLALRVVIGSGIWQSMAVFGVLLSPAFYRLVRGTVSKVRNELYVDAARVSGLSDVRIIGRHVFGVVRGPIVIQAAMILAISMFIQSGLEFLGLGDVNLPSWGSMLNDGFQNIFRGPQLVLWPGVALGITCAALALLASAVRDAMGGAEPARKRPRQVEPGRSPTEARPLGSRRRRPAAGPRPSGRVPERRRGDRRRSSTASPSTVAGRRGRRHRRRVRVRARRRPRSASSACSRRAGGSRPGSSGSTGNSLDGATRCAVSSARSIAYIPQEPLSNLDPSPTPSAASSSSRCARAWDGSLQRGPRPCARAARQRRDHRPGAGVRLLSAPDLRAAWRSACSSPARSSSDPKLLIADEPTTALDVTVQADILDVLRTLQARARYGDPAGDPQLRRRRRPVRPRRT